MANPDTPMGFRPIGPSGGAYTGQTQRCLIPSSLTTAAFIGDTVKTGGSASSDGYPTMTLAAATDPCYGVITSFDANPDNLSLPYRAGTTARYCQVALAENGFFEAQFDGLSEAADVGMNTIYVVAAGSTATGMSGYELSAADVSTAATDEIQIVAFVNRPDNDLTLTNANAIVKFNDPQTKVGRTGVS